MVGDMEIRSLEVFLSVAKHLNFTRAGEEVHLSQPSVSVRIRQLEIELGIKDTRQVEDGVARNEFDFGFVGGHLAGDEVDVHPWLTDQLVLVVSPAHPLARKKSIKPDNLLNEKFILREQGSATRATIVR